MANYATETFTDTNGTAIGSHTPTGNGITAWAQDTGTASQIQSNRLRPQQSFGTSRVGVTVTTYPGPDYEVAVDVVMNSSGTSNTWMEIFGRANSGAPDADNYRARYDAGNGRFELFKSVGNVETSLGTFATAYSAGATKVMVLRMSGTAISLIVDGTVRIGPVTDSGVSATGVAKLKWNVDGVDFTFLEADNFKIQDVGDATGGGPVSLSPAAGALSLAGLAPALSVFDPNANNAKIVIRGA